MVWTVELLALWFFMQRFACPFGLQLDASPALWLPLGSSKELERMDGLQKGVVNAILLAVSHLFARGWLCFCTENPSTSWEILSSCLSLCLGSGDLTPEPSQRPGDSTSCYNEPCGPVVFPVNFFALLLLCKQPFMKPFLIYLNLFIPYSF